MLILTARDGLQLGADDYMTKPFDLRELEARVQALLRRSRGGFDQELTLGRLRLAPFDHQFHLGDNPLLLPSREQGVLEALMLSAGTEELADNAIEVYIHRLRRRLAPEGISIRTLRGLGYVLEKNTAHEPAAKP